MSEILLSANNQSIKIISGAFHRALDNLHIEPNRYRSLPIRQRKLALQEAIYRTAGSMARDIDWISDRSGFYEKNVWDFSPDEIRLHQTFVDVYIALACLGVSSSILPLITYMGFPEQRWAITIEPVLKVLAKKILSKVSYRLPSKSEIYHWRSWGINHSDYFPIQDYSNVLMAEIGPEVTRSYKNLTKSSTNLSISINYRQESLGVQKKLYNESQADYCMYFLYPELEKRNLTNFTLLLSEYLDNNRPERNFNTIVSCVNDYIDNNNLSKENLKQFWLKNLLPESINPRVWVLLYDISASEGNDKGLAKKFAKKIAGKDADHGYILVLRDVLTKSKTKESIYRLSNILRKAKSIPNKQQNIFSALLPEIYDIFATWLGNIISTEIESIWILGSEQPTRRKKLFLSFKNKFDENDDLLFNICRYDKTSDDRFIEFSSLLQDLHKLRQPLRDEIDLGVASSVNELYKKILENLKNKASSSSDQLE